MNTPRDHAHALLAKAFAPKGSDEPAVIFCGAHTGGEVYHTPLCETLTRELERLDTAIRQTWVIASDIEDTYMNRENDTFSEGATEGAASVRMALERFLADLGEVKP